MDRVNLFNPFESKPSGHEDPLTWAFLVTLKYNPSLQNLLREMVISRLLPEHGKFSSIWESANIFTQKQSIEFESDPELIVSVLLTNVCKKKEIKVDWIKRKDEEPRYDGIIEYPNGLILIIENKPRHDEVWEEQLSPSLKSFPDDFKAGSDEELLHHSAVCIEWSKVLEGILEFINSKLTPFEGRAIASDFLSFVEEKHPGLTPYRTFELCGGRHEALQRRTDKLCRDIAVQAGLETGEDQEGEYIHRPESIARRIKFYCNEQNLMVCLWPGNTAEQARRLHGFFADNGNAEFLGLADNDNNQWQIDPYIRFFYLNNVINVGVYPEALIDYLNYFVTDQNPIGRWRYDTVAGKMELMNFLDELEHENLINTQNRKQIEAEFFTGKIPYMNFAPGFEISRTWDLDQVIQWEKKNKLEGRIIDALNTPLAAWGEKICKFNSITN